MSIQHYIRLFLYTPAAWEEENFFNLCSRLSGHESDGLRTVSRCTSLPTIYFITSARTREDRRTRRFIISFLLAVKREIIVEASLLLPSYRWINGERASERKKRVRASYSLDLGSRIFSFFSRDYYTNSPGLLDSAIREKKLLPLSWVSPKKKFFSVLNIVRVLRVC